MPLDFSQSPKNKNLNKLNLISHSMKEKIINIIKKRINLSSKEIKNLIEIPPQQEMGDYAFPCFMLSKEFKKSPDDIAKELTEKLRKYLTKDIASIENKGPYVNFFLNKNLLAEKVLKETKKENWGKLNIDKKRIGIEYPGPNTNKALHIGHLRNIAIGESITKISRAVGNKVYHLNIFNDRGILISKAMIAYQKYKKGKTPESENIKEDHFVGDLYVQFSKEAKENPELEKEAQELLKKWEEGDKKTLDLWKKLNSWTYRGMQKTFDSFGLSKIDKNYYESEMYKKGKEIILKGLKKGIFYKKEDGAIAINLDKEKLGEKILLRNDGTSIYITQDIYLAEKRVKDFNLDSSYYIVGSEQEYHFKALFAILEKLGIKKDWHHFSYGLVALPTGKMKGREGNVISADGLIEKTKELAMKNLRERTTNIGQKEIERRSLIIALAAIKYSLLKQDINRQIIFNPNESLSFEGDTGPYLLYSYARASSITRKAKSKKIKIIDLKDIEISLIKKIDLFPQIIEKAYKNLSPNLIANYSYDLAKVFNEFYHECQVIGGIEEGFRLALVESFKITLKKSLYLLGIETLEEM